MFGSKSTTFSPRAPVCSGMPRANRAHQPSHLIFHECMYRSGSNRGCLWSNCLVDGACLSQHSHGWTWPPILLHLFFGRRHIRLPMSSRPVGTKWDGSRRDEVAVWSGFRVIAPRSNSPEHVPNHFGLTSSRFINVLLSSLSGSSRPQASCHMATASYFLVGQALESLPIPHESLRTRSTLTS